jgi:hypothetical protein
MSLAFPEYLITGFALLAAAGLVGLFRSLPRRWALRVLVVQQAYALVWGFIAGSSMLVGFLRPGASMGLPDESEVNLRFAISLGGLSLVVWIVVCAACLREVSPLAWDVGGPRKHPR